MFYFRFFVFGSLLLSCFLSSQSHASQKYRYFYGCSTCNTNLISDVIDAPNESKARITAYNRLSGASLSPGSRLPSKCATCDQGFDLRVQTEGSVTAAAAAAAAVSQASQRRVTKHKRKTEGPPRQQKRIKKKQTSLAQLKKYETSRRALSIPLSEAKRFEATTTFRRWLEEVLPLEKLAGPQAVTFPHEVVTFRDKQGDVVLSMLGKQHFSRRLWDTVSIVNHRNRPIPEVVESYQSVLLDYLSHSSSKPPFAKVAWPIEAHVVQAQVID